VAAVLALAQVAGSAGTSAVAAVASDPVMMIAGDIAVCGSSNDEATAAILAANPGATVQTLGDNVYENGTAAEFNNCYQPSWGQHKARTKPAVGNHEYQTSGATGYYSYFGAAAGNPNQGWYSYDLGAWHVVVLNSNCAQVGGCNAGSPQELWLRSDLAANPVTCTLAVWHHPRFASGLASSATQALWKALFDFGADVVMTGHQHNYERFALLGPTGTPNENGIRSFVVGTGGASLARISTPHASSEVRNDRTFGVVKLTLHDQGYDWAFLPIAGQTFTDSGGEACRGAGPDNVPPTQPTNLAATTPLDRVDLTWNASTDNVGVAGYDVQRDGATIATIAGASYSDETAAPQTTYTYRVRARDAAGNVSPFSNSVTVTTPESLTVQTFQTIADARVQEANPSTNYGTATSLRTDSGPAVETYACFNVTGVTGTVQSARLRLFATNDTADGPSVRKTTDAWGETTLTWANRPAATGPATDDRGAVPLNTYSEWDVTPTVEANGKVCFVLAQPGSDGADFNSREAAANRPQLLVAYTDTPPPQDSEAPTKPTGLNAVMSGGRVDLTWAASTDNVAVTGYHVFRNGSLLAEIGAMTSYADLTVAPNTTYSYEVRARDAIGNLSPLSDPASVTTPNAPQVLTFAALDDTRVQESSPTSNYGTQTLRTDAGPAVETNLRFELGVLPGAVQSAKLRLFVSQSTVDGPAVYPTGTAWTEAAVTWATRPARTGAATDDRGALPSGAYAEWDVTSSIPSSGPVAFVLAQPGTDGADYTNKEAPTNRPQLVVTVFGDPPPPDGVDPSKPTALTANAVADPLRVDLAWQESTDNVGVTGYDIFRDGVPLANIGAVTTYADTSALPNRTYQYTVRARDGAGNTSPLSDPATVTTPAAPQTLTFLPLADTRAEAATPSTNFGTATLIGTDASPNVETFLTFSVSGAIGTIQSAKLRLYATNSSVDGPAVHKTATGWSESGLTWANKPAPVGAASDDKGAVPNSAWSEWNVTPLVTGNGQVSFVLSQPGTDGADFHSRETATFDRRPQLVVTTIP
jgi:chitodextrinase